MTTRQYEGLPRISHKEWLEEGTRLFGPNTDEWKFVCPACGNVAAVKDFKDYKDKGADPSSATQECLGRYTGAGAPEKGKTPCNWAAYGLFNVCTRAVEFSDKQEVTPVFDFASGASL